MGCSKGGHRADIDQKSQSPRLEGPQKKTNGGLPNKGRREKRGGKGEGERGGEGEACAARKKEKKGGQLSPLWQEMDGGQKSHTKKKKKHTGRKKKKIHREKKENPLSRKKTIKK